MLAFIQILINVGSSEFPSDFGPYFLLTNDKSVDF